MQDFRDLKVGDKVWTIHFGESIVFSIQESPNYTYPIKIVSTSGKVKYLSYTLSGKIYENDSHQSLFYSNPNIIPPEKPKKLVKHEVALSIEVDSHGSLTLTNTQPITLPPGILVKASLHFDTLE